jgi:hypothetical protein
VVARDWTDPGWLAEAEAWIRSHVTPTGAIDQPHVRPWATALRVPTAGGVVWFKASAPEVAHEGPVVELLSGRRPELVPPPIAVERERAWMLSADGGTRLREIVASERDLSRWVDVLRPYAELQRDAAADVDAFLAAGVPDRRLAVLPGLYRGLAERLDDDRLRAEVPRVEAMCKELASFGIPETIQHDDLHDAQVFVDDDGAYHVLDWGDSVVSHPFMTLAVTLDGVIAWGVDDVEGSEDPTPYLRAYLGPWGPPAELEPAAALARTLGWILRALSGVDDPGQADATRGRLGMFLGRL